MADKKTPKELSSEKHSLSYQIGYFFGKTVKILLFITFVGLVFLFAQSV